jgi:hypothetical protein
LVTELKRDRKSQLSSHGEVTLLVEGGVSLLFQLTQIRNRKTGRNPARRSMTGDRDGGAFVATAVPDRERQGVGAGGVQV